MSVLQFGLTPKTKPLSPKRSALLAEVLVAALAVGAALAYALDQFNPVVGSTSVPGPSWTLA